jgi:hypothetical protein
MFLRKALSVSLLLFAATFSAAQSQPITIPKVLPTQKGPPQSVVSLPSQPIFNGIQVHIPKECRIFNRSRSQCVWCSLECLGRKHAIPATYTLTQRYKGTSGPGQAASVLQALGVKYYMQTSNDKKFLITACANGWGACVGLNGAHMINVVHYKDGVVKVIDNQGPHALEVQEWRENYFLSRWDGWAITLVPPLILPSKKWF